MEWNEFINLGRESFAILATRRIAAHPRFFEELVKDCPKTFLEVGCGTGAMSYGLSRICDAKGVSVDNDKKIVEALNQKLKGYTQLKIIEGDAFKLPKNWNKKFDLVFHQGLLEHFSNEDIVKIVAENLRVGKRVIFSVPSYYYPKKDFGNERLMKLETWKDILSDFNTTGFYYGDRSYRLFNAITKGNFGFLLKMLGGFGRPHILIEVKENVKK